MEQTAPIIMQGFKAETKDGTQIHVVHNSNTSVKRLFKDWIRESKDHREASFVRYLNMKWKGQSIALSKHCLDVTIMPVPEKETWTPAYFEFSEGTPIDIMFTIPGPNRVQLITAVVEEWLTYANEYTEKDFLQYFREKYSNFKAISKKEYFANPN